MMIRPRHATGSPTYDESFGLTAQRPQLIQNIRFRTEHLLPTDEWSPSYGA